MLKRLVNIIVICSLIAICCPQEGAAQIWSPTKDDVYKESDVKHAFETAPYFGIYKDNYFIFGPQVGPKSNRHNTNLKFQVSVAQRLTKSTLPGGTYLYLFYTQKCFWNVLEESFPMHDLNFNPGIGLTKPLFSNNRFIGKLTFILEHESNGRDSTDSRSWNRISLVANVLVAPHLMAYGKLWIPIVDGENNRDLLDYMGIFTVGMSYMPLSERFSATVLFTKRRGWDLNFNTTVELSYKLGRNSNQYLFLQFYNGYGEGMLDYNVFSSALRAGFVIRPRFFSDF